MVRYSIHNQLKSCKIIHHKPCFHVKTMKFKILLLINVIRAPNSLEKLSCDSFTQGLSRIAHNEWSSGGVDGRCCHPKKVIQGEIFVFKEDTKQILTNTLELSPVCSLESEQHLRTQRHSETVFRSCNFFSNIRRVIHSLVPRLPVPSQEK